MTRTGRPTSMDVARLAKVSQATVSFVLSGTSRQTIPAETRERVQQAAKDLGYVPSAAARSLRAGRSDVVLCLADPTMRATKGDDLWDVLSRRLAERGLYCVISRNGGTGVGLEELLAAITPGLIVTFVHLPADQLELLQKLRIPLIEMLFYARGERPATTTFQEEIGAVQLTHLLDRGCRQPRYLSSVPIEEGFAHARIAGAGRVAAERGVALQAHRVEPVDVESATAALAELLAEVPELDGLACFNDELAIAMLTAAQRLGIEVPQRLRIIGVDDLPVTRLLSPAVSTVSMEIGVLVDQLLPEVLAHCRPDEQPEPPAVRSTGGLPTLIWRETT